MIDMSEPATTGGVASGVDGLEEDDASRGGEELRALVV